MVAHDDFSGRTLRLTVREGDPHADLKAAWIGLRTSSRSQVAFGAEPE